MAEKTTKKKVTTKAPKTAVTKAEKAPKRSTGTRTAKAATASTPAKIERTRVKEERPTEERVETQPATENKAVRVKKSYFFTVLGIVLLVLLAVLFRNLFVAAMVNNHPISRLAVISELEKQGGKQTLESLITKSLIVQEADKRHIEISQKDIDGEIKKIQNNLASQGQTLEQVLQLQNMTKDQLVEQIKLQKIIEKSPFIKRDYQKIMMLAESITLLNYNDRKKWESDEGTYIITSKQDIMFLYQLLENYMDSIFLSVPNSLLALHKRLTEIYAMDIEFTVADVRNDIDARTHGDIAGELRRLHKALVLS